MALAMYAPSGGVSAATTTSSSSGWTRLETAI
jgi:hypothetical protein